MASGEQKTTEPLRDAAKAILILPAALRLLSSDSFRDDYKAEGD